MYECLCDPCERICRRDQQYMPDGTCVCRDGEIELNGRCASPAPFIAVGVIGGVAIIVAAFYAYVRIMLKRSDRMWHIKPSGELQKPVVLLNRHC